MAVNGISGSLITGTLSDGNFMLKETKIKSEKESFERLVKEASSSKESAESVSSSSYARNHKLNGDYTRGFYGLYTSEADKSSRPRGFAANSSGKNGKKAVIDRTSDLYAQSMEMENYIVKMMLSSMRKTVQHTSLAGSDNDYARNMYEDMMYDNVSESITKNAGLGLADQIYLELSGQ